MELLSMNTILTLARLLPQNSAFGYRSKIKIRNAHKIKVEFARDEFAA